MGVADIDQMEETSTVDAEAVTQENQVKNQDVNSHEAVSAKAEPGAFQGRELTAVLEALLFVSGEAVPVTRLVSVIGTVSKAEVEQALKALQEQLDQDGRGIQLVEVAGGYRLVTKSDYAPWLKRLDKAKTAQKLSRSALESLAIIAYKQPLVRAEVEEIRGVETSGVIRTLLERKLVRIVGRKEVPGRPIMYGTTKFFLEHFGLQDLSQLPPLREFKELGEAEQALLPIDETTVIGEAREAEDVIEIEVDGADTSIVGENEVKETVLVGGASDEDGQVANPLYGEPVEQA